MWLSWISPEVASAFTIKVTGKILPDTDGQGGGTGEVTPIDIEASWEGEVTSFTMEVRRMDSGDSFSSSATVAAGHIGNAGHQAEIEITAKDEEGNPMAGVEVPAIRVSSGGQNATGTINADPPSMNSTVTDANGKVTGTFTSGNRVEVTTLRLDIDGDAATTEGEPTISIDQKWNELEGSDDAWESGEYFTTGVQFPIIYKMTFDDGVPITGHTINFKTKSITGWEWDADKPVDEDGDGVVDYYGDYDEDKTYDDTEPELQPSGKYADLVKYVPQTTTGASDGEYSTNMTANDFIGPEGYVDFYTDVVAFGIEDTSIRIYK